MAEHETSVTGPTLDTNSTHVPCMGGAGGVEREASTAAYPSKSQGCFKGATPVQDDMPGAPLALRKSYPKHAGEAAEIRGPLTAKFNGG